MLILFDNGTPRGLARFLTGHSVEELRGWEELSNGELIDIAEQAGFEVMVLEHSQWPMVKLVAENILAAVNAAEPGSYIEVDVPFKE